MKKGYVLLFILVLTTLKSIGQEIEFTGGFSAGSAKLYLKGFGCGVGYDQNLGHRNRLGFLFSVSFFSATYDDIYTSTEDGSSVYVKKVDPENKRLAFRVNFSHDLIHSEKARLYIGPEIGLNYFLIREDYERIPNGNITGGEFSNRYSKNNKISIGFLLEYVIRNLITKELSTYMSIHPEVSGFENAGTKGAHNPAFIGWLNFSIGVRYNFSRKD